ncbi:MAG: hypothetical protein KIT27_07245 [Legionellales bacterium]|nr:hypothetical protein [Legionellales bacterium]
MPEKLILNLPNNWRELVLEQYQTATLINPPQQLSSIFITPAHTLESIRNLAITYAVYQKDFNVQMENDATIQLFEVPVMDACCLRYTLLGYDFLDNTQLNKELTSMVDWRVDDLIKEGWVKLDDPKDFSTHQGFEKIFFYHNSNVGTYSHFTRQWGDGTVLSKDGTPTCGATPVVRALSPEHAVITARYGEVRATYIRPYHKNFNELLSAKPTAEVPVPYLRWQSSHLYAFVSSEYAFSSLEKVIARADNYLNYFNDCYINHYLQAPDTESYLKAEADIKSNNAFLLSRLSPIFKNSPAISVASLKKDLERTLTVEHPLKKPK